MVDGNTSSECEWREDDEGNWDTDCGEKFILCEGTPSQNRMRFCAYCGKSLRERVYVAPTAGEQSAAPRGEGVDDEQK